MSISWLDPILVALILIPLVMEFRRGFGRAIFDFAGVLVAFVLAKIYYPNLAGSIHPFQTEEANLLLGFLVLLALGLVFFLILADLAYNSLLVSTDVFERILGGLCGLAIGFAFAHALAFGIWLGTGRDDDRAGVFVNSTVAREMLTFPTYNRGVAWLVGLGQENKPDVSSM